MAEAGLGLIVAALVTGFESIGDRTAAVNADSGDCPKKRDDVGLGSRLMRFGLGGLRDRC